MKNIKPRMESIAKSTFFDSIDLSIQLSTVIEGDKVFSHSFHYLETTSY